MVIAFKKILITSGPTRASLDAVRFLSNRSTGRFGTLLVEEALRNRMKVTMVYGRGSQTPRSHPRLRLIPIETNDDLGRVLKRELSRGGYYAVIHAMAVLDFQASRVRKGKVGSRGGKWTLELKPTPKIIQKIKVWSPKSFLIGFKLEVSEPVTLLAHARRLMKESKADMVVGNFLTEGEDERHAGYLVTRRQQFEIKKVTGKKKLAKAIMNWVIKQS
ncbi:MAG: hypothetical protein HYT76_06835 [Deltaproteobacteria bacterium]|nr:hypothetical protein [Deltaproteobacteria bacterium]